jgi:alpha-glucosidase (family GH31 glycosyl hydrolase)
MTASLQGNKLPPHWRIKQDPICQIGITIKEETWRFSLLTPGLLRLEYCPDGVFEDRATQFALNRNFPPFSFTFEDSPDELLVSTENLILRYDKKPFSKNGLSVRLRGKAGNSLWRYGDQRENLGGTLRTLDNVNGAAALEPGLLSKNGIAVVDDSRTLAIDSEGWVQPRCEDKIDLYVFAYGRDYRSCLKDFYRLTGPVPLLPRYALGNWWSRFYRYTEQSYKELIERFEMEKLPFSVSVIDMDWHLTEIDPALGSGWTGFTWNRELFPNPKDFLAWLHGKNLRVTLNLHPADGIRAHEDAYGRIAKRMGVDPVSRKPVEFDASNPDFLQAYFEEVLRPMEEEGVDFWWVDWQQGDTTAVPGLDPLWVLNHFHFLDGARRSKRPLTFSRYAGLGSHRYPVGFSGDSIISWASLDFQPYFTAIASNAGYGWWSHDIGGHMGGVRDDELAVRWVQFGVFSPICRLHANSNPFNSKEPWHFNPLAGKIMADFLQLRHRLIPYLYSMNHRASFEGEPLIQPLYYTEPHNNIAYCVPNEYYFGSELLCCPLTTPMSKEAQAAGFKAWLPSGVWIDFFNGRVYSGDRVLELWRGLETFPVLAKAGGIIPLADAVNFTNSVENPAALELFIFTGADGHFNLWEDRDDSDAWAETLFSLDWEKRQFVISPAIGDTAAIPAVRSWHLHFCGFTDIGVKLFVGGRQLPAEPVYDENTKRLSLIVTKVQTNEELRIEFEEAELARNDILKELFDFLDGAWIEFEVKRAVFNMVEENGCGVHALASLQAFHLPGPVYSGICEILSALDERGLVL